MDTKKTIDFVFAVELTRVSELAPDVTVDMEPVTLTAVPPNEVSSLPLDAATQELAPFVPFR